MRSNFLLSFLRALKLPLKLLAGFLRKNKYQKIIKKDYEPKFRKNEKRIESLFSKKRKRHRKFSKKFKIIHYGKCSGVIGQKLF